MTGADIGLGWIDQTGQLHFQVNTSSHLLFSINRIRAVYLQDRYAYTFARPMIDNTTIDWFGLLGREENGWTAIQFRRALDTCDTMDFPIKVCSLISFDTTII